MRIFGIVLLAGTALGVGVPAGANEWLYREEVSYVTRHDPVSIELKGGHELQVSYAGITWKDVSGWKVGRRLVIAYKPETGSVLLDPATGKHTSILRSTKMHPIDTLWRKEAREAPNTIASAAIQVKAGSLWDKELNRVYKLLLEDAWPRKFTRQEKDALINSQRKWIQFRDAQLAAIGVVYGKRNGTVQKINSAHQAMELTRSQALRLGSFLVP